MSIKIMTGVWETSRYEGARLLIHLAMADHAHDDGWFFCSQESLANKARCSVEYVRQTVLKMLSDGVLAIEKKGSARGRATEYRLLQLHNSIGNGGNAKSSNSPTELAELPNSDGQLPNFARGQSSYTTVLTNRPINTGTSDAFEEFWKIYPRKSGKSAARKAFAAACKDDDATIITAAAFRYSADPNREPQYTKHPATWLNQGCWEDDPLPSKSGKDQQRQQDRMNLIAWALEQEQLGELEA